MGRRWSVSCGIEHTAPVSQRSDHHQRGAGGRASGYATVAILAQGNSIPDFCPLTFPLIKRRTGLGCHPPPVSPPCVLSEVAVGNLLARSHGPVTCGDKGRCWAPWIGNDDVCSRFCLSCPERSASGAGKCCSSQFTASGIYVIVSQALRSSLSAPKHFRRAEVLFLTKIYLGRMTQTRLETFIARHVHGDPDGLVRFGTHYGRVAHGARVRRLLPASRHLLLGGRDFTEYIMMATIIFNHDYDRIIFETRQ